MDRDFRGSCALWVVCGCAHPTEPAVAAKPHPPARVALEVVEQRGDRRLLLQGLMHGMAWPGQLVVLWRDGPRFEAHAISRITAGRAHEQANPAPRLDGAPHPSHGLSAEAGAPGRRQQRAKSGRVRRRETPVACGAVLAC